MPKKKASKSKTSSKDVKPIQPRPAAARGRRTTGTVAGPSTKANGMTDFLKQYECGPVPLERDPDAAFRRHLVFDHMVEPEKASTRQKFQAVARALRDLLAQRWLKTKQTYFRENPKRVYYLSMEFLIGRSLTNNITNLMVDPLVRQVMEREGLDLMELAEAEPLSLIHKSEPTRRSYNS
jgi:hypothetical protein